MTADENMDDVIEDFIVESGEMIESMDQDLVALEKSPNDLGLLNRVFRYVHTVKGTSDFLHFKVVTALAHAMEDVLDPLRSGKISMNPEIMDLILEGVDGLKRLMAEVKARSGHGDDMSGLAARLRAAGKGASSAPAPASPTPPPAPAPKAPAPPAPDRGMGAEEMKELMADFLAESAELMQKVDRDIFTLDVTGFDIDLYQRMFRCFHTIKGTSGFLGLSGLKDVAGELEAMLEPIRSGAAKPGPDTLARAKDGLEAARALHAAAAKGEIGTADPAVLSRIRGDAATSPAPEQASQAAVSRAVNPQPTPPSTKPKPAAGESGAAEAVKTAASPRPDGPQKEAAESTVRVDTERLDNLMNLVGEMVLGRNRLLQAVRGAENRREIESSLAALSETADFIDMITSDLQKAVIKTRMQAVGRIFNKFPRMVRDLAREKEKKVGLVILGAETELDKSVIDEISDPLVHLIRNAVDHGIETPRERAAAGKPEQGTITLAARQEGNRIAIDVSDDGKGLDPEKIRSKAKAKGLMGEQEAAGLSDADLFNLIFLPGFSTAETVGRTSGRGVGMDVVKSNIEKLGGYVELESEPGRGVRFIVKLPLTLAIIPVLMVSVGREVYAIPSVSVIESLRVHPDEIKTVDGKEVINLRGRILPILRLADLFGVREGDHSSWDRRYVVVVGLAERRVGLMIHGLIGQEEVVIKALGDMFENTAGISGATIRGDGRVALIVDMASLVRISASGREETRSSSVTRRRPAPVKQAAPAQRASGARLNVLVVDDSATERKIVRMAIEAAGHRVFESGDGQTALARLSEIRFDLVITDIEMDGMDGYKLTRKIRSNPGTKNLPVVALSSHGQMVDRIKGSEAGVDAYLVKPLDREQLAKTIESVTASL